MDGPSDHHTRWNKSQKDKYHMISLLSGIHKNDTSELIYKTKRLSDIENKFIVTKGEREGGIY